MAHASHQHVRRTSPGRITAQADTLAYPYSPFINRLLSCRLTCLLRTSCLCCVRLASLSHVVACGGPAVLFALRASRARVARVLRTGGGGGGGAGVSGTPPPPGGGGAPRAGGAPPPGGG